MLVTLRASFHDFLIFKLLTLFCGTVGDLWVVSGADYTYTMGIFERVSPRFLDFML